MKHAIDPLHTHQAMRALNGVKQATKTLRWEEYVL